MLHDYDDLAELPWCLYRATDHFIGGYPNRRTDALGRLHAAGCFLSQAPIRPLQRPCLRPHLQAISDYLVGA